jgi:hypothetical protein
MVTAFFLVGSARTLPPPEMFVRIPTDPVGFA